MNAGISRVLAIAIAATFAAPAWAQQVTLRAVTAFAEGTQFSKNFERFIEKVNQDGKGDPPTGRATYYGGYGQSDVKPTPDSPLLKLGVENVPPIVTTAVLLDAKSHLGSGEAMPAGALVTAADIEAMLKKQGLGERGLQRGDVLYIYTGWGDGWKDPDTEKTYYTKGPGLSYDAAKYIEGKQIVLVALDNPYRSRA